MWRSGFKNGWSFRCMKGNLIHLELGRQMGSTWKVINTQVPVTLTVAPALGKEHKHQRKELGQFQTSRSPNQSVLRKLVALGHRRGKRAARAGDTQFTHSSGLSGPLGCKLNSAALTRLISLFQKPKSHLAKQQGRSCSCCSNFLKDLEN